MTWCYLMIHGLVSGLGAWLGWRTRRLGAWRTIAALLAATLLMALRVYLHGHPEHEQHLLRLSEDYVYFTSWDVPVTVFLLVALAARLRGGRLRRLVLISVAMLAPLFVWDSLSACLLPDYTMGAQFDSDGVCLQATDYSCGPAAGVTLLRLLGQDATEGELAELSLLKPDRGVTALELCRGLTIMLRPTGRRAVIHQLPAEELDRQAPPFLAQLRRRGNRAHCVVLLAALEDCVILADPASGQYAQPRGVFLREWTGIAIRVEPE